MQFCCPKPLGRRSGHCSSSCHCPSTRKRYSCSPSSSETVAFQAPSFCFLRVTGLCSQPVKSPSNMTVSAEGAKKVNDSFFPLVSFFRTALGCSDSFSRAGSIKVPAAVLAIARLPFLGRVFSSATYIDQHALNVKAQVPANAHSSESEPEPGISKAEDSPTGCQGFPTCR